MKFSIVLILVLVVVARCGGGSHQPPPKPTPTPVPAPTAFSPIPTPTPTVEPSPRPCSFGNEASIINAAFARGEDMTISGDCSLGESVVVAAGRTLTIAGTLRPTTNGIPILVQSGGSVRGTGWDSVIYESIAEGQFTVIAAYNSANKNGDADERITISDVRIEGANSGFYSAPQTISLGNCSHCAVERVWLNKTRTIGIQYGGAGFFGNHASDSVVRDCLLTNVASQAIAVVNGRNIVIENNRIIGLGQPGGPGAAAGIDLEPNHADDVLENVVVQNNFIDGADSPRFGNGIIVQAADATQIGGVVVEDNEVRRTVNGLMVFGVAMRDVQLRRNKVTRTSQSCIYFQGADIVATDNPLTDCGGGGTPGGYLVLTGNSVFARNPLLYSGSGPFDARLIVANDFAPETNSGWTVVRR